MPSVSSAAVSEPTSRKLSVSRLLRGTGQFIYTILAGSSLVFLGVVINKMYLAFQFIPLADSHHYISHLLSAYVIPLVAGQGVFFLAVYFEWQRKKKALLEAHQQELKAAREEAALQSAQKMVGFISEHVTANNAEIQKWLQFRKGQTQQVSARVERASHGIARAMQALTELAFVYPYSLKPVSTELDDEALQGDDALQVEGVDAPPRQLTAP